MRATVDGVRFYDSKFVQGLFWATVFQNLVGAGGYVMPDDPEPCYAFFPDTAATPITLPRIIGNIVFGGPAGLLAGTHVIDGLCVEIINTQTAVGTLQAKNAAGDAAGANVGPVIPVAPSATQAAMAVFQIVNGKWQYLKAV
jgi:hypothetical protein